MFKAEFVTLACATCGQYFMGEDDGFDPQCGTCTQAACFTCNIKDRELREYYGPGPYSEMDPTERKAFHSQHLLQTSPWVRRAQLDTLPVKDSTGGGHFAYKPNHS